MGRLCKIHGVLIAAIHTACTGEPGGPELIAVLPSSVAISQLPIVVAVEGLNLVDRVSVSLDDEHAVQRRPGLVTIGDVALTSLQRTSPASWEGTIPVALGAGVYDVTLTLGDGRRTQLVGGFTVLDSSGQLVAPSPAACNGAEFGVVQPIWAEPTDRDFGPALSADRLTLVFARETAGQQDLYWARRSNVLAPFGAAVHIPELSGGNNTAPIFSRDGLRLYFASDRGGNWDIWLATRTQLDSSFGDLHALSEVNSVQADSRPWLTADELTLYFESDRTLATGYDLWRASRDSIAEPFFPPTPVPQMASPSLEGSPALTPDGLMLYYVSDVLQTPGRRTLHRAVRDNEQDVFTPGAAVAPLASYDMSGHAHLSADGRELVFSASDGPAQRLWRVLINCTDNE